LPVGALTATSPDVTWVRMPRKIGCERLRGSAGITVDVPA
jgi:hypothetical protein